MPSGDGNGRLTAAGWVLRMPGSLRPREGYEASIGLGGHLGTAAETVGDHRRHLTCRTRPDHRIESHLEGSELQVQQAIDGRPPASSLGSERRDGGSFLEGEAAERWSDVRVE